MKQNYLLGCDWGTTSFRLGIYDLEQNKLAGEIHSKDGIARTYRVWQSGAGGNKEMTKHQVFRQQLGKHLEELSAMVSFNIDDIPLVISGMASSSIGMENVEYASLPFSIDGSGAITRRLEAVEGFPHDILLISGISSANDVMRGEETQLIGLISLLKAAGVAPEDAVMVFPGTHSKHIHIRKGKITDFHTYMTGEIFHLLVHYSILKDSVDVNDTEMSRKEADAFRKGVRDSSCNVLNSLFKVRTNQLFGKLDKRENLHYLSGMLIGAEISHLLKSEKCQLFLCTASNLFPLYSMAIETLDLEKRSIIVPIELVDKAAIAGQVLIYRKCMDVLTSTQKLFNEQ